jgi:hypothetical protein
MSQNGSEVTDCVICHKPCLKAYYLISDRPPQPSEPIPKEYCGGGLICYYPDGKQNINILSKDWPFACYPCRKKHFEQSSKHGNYGDL